MAPKKALRSNLWTIGQESDAQEILLLGEINGVTEQVRSISVIPVCFVHDQVLQQNDEAPFRRANGKEQVNHPDDHVVPAQDKDAAPVRLCEDEPQSAQLLLLVRSEVTFLAEKFAQEFRKLIQV